MSTRGHMLRVGPFIFSISTAAYQNLTRTDTYRWQTVEVIGGELANQYMGPGERTITLDGVVYTHYDAGRAPFQPQAVVGTEQVAALRAVADAGAPVNVTDGRGRAYGKWVITSLNSKSSVFMDNGAEKKQEFDLSLRYYTARSGGFGSFGVAGLNPGAKFGGLIGGGAIKQVVASAQALAKTSIGINIEAGLGIKAGISAAGIDLDIGLPKSLGLALEQPIGELTNALNQAQGLVDQVQDAVDNIELPDININLGG